MPRSVIVKTIVSFSDITEKSISFSKEDRNKMTELKKNATAEKKTGTSRPAQKSKYYGANIGQHVKVQPQMRENREERH